MGLETFRVEVSCPRSSVPPHKLLSANLATFPPPPSVPVAMQSNLGYIPSHLYLRIQQVTGSSKAPQPGCVDRRFSFPAHQGALADSADVFGSQAARKGVLATRFQFGLVAAAFSIA